MLTDVDAVLFDLDGTLVDTIPLIVTCYAHTLATHLPAYRPDRRVLLGNIGRSLRAILRDYAVEAGAAEPDAMAESMLETYRAFQREHLSRLIRPYEGVREALAALCARGLTLGMVTSKTEWAARLTYERYGLDEFLSVRVFHDDTERHKPDPDPLLLALARGGLIADRTVYVGDSVHDMAAGRAAGLRTVGVLWGPTEREVLLGAGADVVIERPSQLPELFPASPARVG